MTKLVYVLTRASVYSHVLCGYDRNENPREPISKSRLESLICSLLLETIFFFKWLSGEEHLRMSWRFGYLYGSHMPLIRGNISFHFKTSPESILMSLVSLQLLLSFIVNCLLYGLSLVWLVT